MGIPASEVPTTWKARAEGRSTNNFARNFRYVGMALSILYRGVACSSLDEDKRSERCEAGVQTLGILESVGPPSFSGSIVRACPRLRSGTILLDGLAGPPAATRAAMAPPDLFRGHGFMADSVLVTGGEGYLGSILTALTYCSADFESRSWITCYWRAEPVPSLCRASLRFVHGDVRDEPLLRRLTARRTS